MAEKERSEKGMGSMVREIEIKCNIECIRNILPMNLVVFFILCVIIILDLQTEFNPT